MKFSPVASAAAALLPLASAFQPEEYESGEVMQLMMESKESAWAKHRAAGEYDSSRFNGFAQNRSAPGVIECTNGVVEAIIGDPDQTYRCNNIDLYDYKTHEELGDGNSEGSGSWGWVHEGREFIALGHTSGTAFAEVTKEGKLRYLGRLTATGQQVIWREIKTLGDYLIVGSEGLGAGVQIFDLKNLLYLCSSRPRTFDPETYLTSWFNDLTETPVGLVGRSHNVVANEESGWIAAVGSGGRPGRNDTCAGGIIFINVDDITNPYKEGCASQDGYVHDAQCLVYRGPDERYYGRDVCYGYNEDTLTIYDASNRTGFPAATVISRTPYVGASYTHQGWVNDPNWQTHLILDDELDEGEIDPNRTHPGSPAIDGFPVTYIWDISDLENPVQTGIYKSGTRSVDHNQFIIDGLAYQSNYQAGLRILDVSSIPEFPDGSQVEEIGFFDVYPPDDHLPGGGAAIWDFGTWSHYTFPSGFTVVHTIDRGAFVVKLRGQGRGKGKYIK
ncbi:hypothetical protein B0I35DRAFT_383692 [Stachybotrys elegans]|uniref:Uncharacterized protein n=1 Tax=Stachybotrys elegans TaxID=80388 RepID=A0A8K0SE41_9HYPO|nr:hypothetical protein B0I35DRAFT_383692 [Stachybotrys elegans]